MGSPVLVGLDPGTRRLGWAVGTGETLPLCGAFRFDQAGENLGLMADAILGELEPFLDVHRPVEVAYEGPILTKFDRLPAIRKTYSVGTLIELACHRRGIPVVEVGLREVKRELAGMFDAKKHHITEAARKLGVTLPLTEADGREDAADALGVFLILLRARSPRLSAEYDRKLWSARGALL